MQTNNLDLNTKLQQKFLRSNFINKKQNVLISYSKQQPPRKNGGIRGSFNALAFEFYGGKRTKKGSLGYAWLDSIERNGTRNTFGFFLLSAFYFCNRIVIS
jgi:hypothetical protein